MSRNFCIVVISPSVPSFCCISGFLLNVKIKEFLFNHLPNSHKWIVHFLIGHRRRNCIMAGFSFCLRPCQFLLHIFILRFNGECKLQILDRVFMSTIDQLNIKIVNSKIVKRITDRVIREFCNFLV